jgi:hypothetical protein
MGGEAISQWNMYRQRQGQLDNVALRQAELANGDLAGMLDGVRQFALAAAQVPEVHSAGPACEERLASLQHGLMAYRFLAVYRPSGRLLCASCVGRTLCYADGSTGA